MNDIKLDQERIDLIIRGPVVSERDNRLLRNDQACRYLNVNENVLKIWRDNYALPFIFKEVHYYYYTRDLQLFIKRIYSKN